MRKPYCLRRLYFPKLHGKYAPEHPYIAEQCNTAGYFLFNCRCNREPFSPFRADYIHLVSCSSFVSGWSLPRWVLRSSTFCSSCLSSYRSHAQQVPPKHISFERTLTRDQPEALRTTQWCVLKIIFLLSVAISLLMSLSKPQRIKEAEDCCTESYYSLICCLINHWEQK